MSISKGELKNQLFTPATLPAWLTRPSEQVTDSALEPDTDK